MTLDEVKKMKAEKKADNPLLPQELETAPETVIKKAVEMLKTPELEPAPVEFLLKASAEPHLLHEEIESHEVTRPELVTAVSYDRTVDAVLKNARLTPSPELMPRFQSLIMSLIKGVRTVAQVMEYASAPLLRGGLALSIAEAERLATALNTQTGLPNNRSIIIPKPMTAPASTPSNIQGSVKNNPTSNRPHNTGAAFVQMHDVQAPQSAPSTSNKAVMGPIEEMKIFSLLDWRRLAATPDKAKEIILSKFSGWKDESFFLYRDTRLAWLESPLVREYQEKVITAINQSTRLSDMASGFAVKKTLTPADIAALVEVNRVLAV